MNKIKMKILKELYSCMSSCFITVGWRIHSIGKYFLDKWDEVQEMEDDNR